MQGQTFNLTQTVTVLHGMLHKLMRCAGVLEEETRPNLSRPIAQLVTGEGAQLQVRRSCRVISEPRPLCISCCYASRAWLVQPTCFLKCTQGLEAVE